MPSQIDAAQVQVYAFNCVLLYAQCARRDTLSVVSGAFYAFVSRVNAAKAQF